MQNFIISENPENTSANIHDFAFSRKHVNTAHIESFLDKSKGVVAHVTTYNHGNKFRKVQAYNNGNLNKYQNAFKQVGGDTRKRLQSKLLMKRIQEAL